MAAFQSHYFKILYHDLALETFRNSVLRLNTHISVELRILRRKLKLFYELSRAAGNVVMT